MEIPFPWQLLRLIWPAPVVAQAIHTAARLGIPDLLEEGPKNVRELAHATGTDALSLRRLLRALATLGVFAEDGQGRYEQTQLSAVLCASHPQSMRKWALLIGSHFMWNACGDLAGTVRTGEPAFNRIYDSPFYTYLSEHPDEAAIFHGAMGGGWESPIPMVVSAYDFSRFERIVDIGGGRGVLLRQILEASPTARGVLLDLPRVVAQTAAQAAGPLADRCEIVAGNFLESVPAGGDAYVVRGIIHDWDDAAAVRILSNCRRAIRPDGTLLVFDALLGPPGDPALAMMDLLVMVLLGGRERTESEFGELLDRSGFRLSRVIPVVDGSTIIEGRPV